VKTTRIEWHEHPELEKIEEWVGKKLPDLPKDFAENAYKGCIHLKDFKYTAGKWLLKQIELLRELTLMIDALPDLDTPMIEVDESEW
jgi:hypothetical protein